MSMYQIKILPSAGKDLDQIPVKAFDTLRKKVLILTQDPRPQGTIKLTNEEGYRIRIGDYRVLYRINDPTKEIFIYRIKHRKDAYR